MVLKSFLIVKYAGWYLHIYPLTGAHYVTQQVPQNLFLFHEDRMWLHVLPEAMTPLPPLSLH